MNVLNSSVPDRFQLVRSAIGWLVCGLFVVVLGAPRALGQTAKSKVDQATSAAKRAADWALGPSAKLNLDRLKSLEKRASEVTDVTLDRKMLRLASGFISDDKSSDDAETRALIDRLKGIYVRDYEFDKTGQYTQADLDAIRAQLRAPQWSKIVNVRSQHEGETDEIYIMGSSDHIQGLAIISAEPKELTVVNIVGPIDLNQLSHLEGHLGVPRVEWKQDRNPPSHKGASHAKAN